MPCVFGEEEQQPAFCCPKSLAFPLLCLESHPPLLVHPQSASIPPSSFRVAQALLFAEFLRRPQVFAPQFSGGAWSARHFCSSFPMQASTLFRVPVPRRDPHHPSPCDALCPCCANGCDKGVAAAPHHLGPPKAGVGHTQQQPGCQGARSSSQQNWKQRLRLLHKLGKATKKNSPGSALGALRAPSPAVGSPCSQHPGPKEQLKSNWNAQAGASPSSSRLPPPAPFPRA